MAYDPESHNAVFARMEEKLDSIQNSITEVKENNIRLSEKVSIIESINVTLSDLKINTGKLSERVSSLEHFKYYLIGAASLISSVGAYVINKLFTKDS